MNIDVFSSNGNVFGVIYTPKFKLLESNITSNLNLDGIIYIKNNTNKIMIQNKDGSVADFCLNACVIINYLLAKYDKFYIGKNKFYRYQKTNKVLLKLNYKEEVVDDRIFVDLDNKHILIRKNELNKDALLEDGKLLSSLYKRNIGFYNYKNNKVNLLTYEYGVGFTNSCGTNSLALTTYLNKQYKYDYYLITSNNFYKYKIEYLKKRKYIVYEGIIKKHKAITL